MSNDNFRDASSIVPLAELTGQASVVVEAPIDRVYNYMANFGLHAEWNKNIYKVWQTTPGPVQVGSRFKAMEGAPPTAPSRQVKALLQVMIGMFTGNKMFSEAEVTELTPHQRIAWVGIFPRSHGEFNRAEWSVELEPEGNATRVVQRFRYLPQTAAARRMLAALGDA